MTVIYGMLDMRDTTVAQQRLADIGLDRLGEFAAAELAMYNEIADELMGKLSFASTEFMVRYGAQGEFEMIPAEEYSRPDVQRVGMGYSLGFPIDRYQVAVGWTRDFWRRKTVGDFTRTLDAATAADLRLLIKKIKTALFLKTNYTYADELKGDLAVKRLINADSTPINPFDGNTFDGSTHTHYLPTAGTSLADADAKTIEDHLIEHGHDGNLVLYINPAQETAVRGLTDFEEARRPYIIDPTGRFADVSNANDRHILGRLRSMEVRVRNWMPAGYLFAFNEYGVNSPLNPLHRRLSDLAEDNSLHIAGTDERFPLYTQFMERFIGFGAYNRTNGVVMYIDTGNGDVYVDPTIT